ncbi:MAG: MerR family transcriptional regulator [Notoacmeibacter sp.]
MLSIGKLSLKTNVKVPTIRYYEDAGMLPPPERSQSNQRLYGQPTVDRLNFIRHARELGFPLDAIRDLLSLSDNPNQSCAAADAIAQVQLRAVEARILRLQNLKSELENMVAQCAGGKISQCRVIEALGDHTHCDHNHSDAH